MFSPEAGPSRYGPHTECVWCRKVAASKLGLKDEQVKLERNKDKLYTLRSR